MKCSSSDHLKKGVREIRADRLIQALLLLQGRPQITAAQLAVELEVSVPTARRDLEALAMAGVPLYPTRGRGGGWRLIGGARTDLTGLTEPETTALLVALAQGGQADAEQAAAVRKLVRAMPAPFREGAQRVASATVRDAPWGQTHDDESTGRVALLQRAIARRNRVRLQYAGARGAIELEVVPLVVGSRGSRWYLLAAPAAEGGDVADEDRLRTYRVDRMRDAAALPLRGIPPEGFDIQDAWATMVDRVEELRGGVRATVRVEPWAVRALCDRFGPQAALQAEGGRDGDPRPLVEVRAHRADALAEQLAGWSAVVDVIGPDEVRDELARLGRALVERYDRGIR